MLSKIKKQNFQIGLAPLLFIPLAIIVATLGFWQYWLLSSHYYESARTVTERLRGLTRERVSSITQDFFASVNELLSLNKSIIEDLPGSTDSQILFLARVFSAQLQQEASLTYISFGSVDGWYIGAHRNPDTAEILLAVCSKPGQPLINYSYENIASIEYPPPPQAEVSRSDSAFDPRTRPWYQAALAAGNTATWYPVYRYTNYRGLGTGMSVRINKDTAGANAKGLDGVASVDIALSSLNTLFEALPLGQHGFTILCDTDGTILAGSQYRDGKVQIASSADPLLKAAWQILSQAKIDASTGAGDFQYKNKRYLVDWTAVGETQNPTRVLITVLPESDFYTDPSQGRMQTFNIIAVLLSALGLCIWLLVNHIVRRLRSLVDGASVLVQGLGKTSPLKPTTIRELTILGQSIEGISEMLEKSRNHLESSLSENRIKVLELQNRATFAAQKAAETAHEIASPLSNSILAAAHVNDLIVKLETKFKAGSLARADFESFLEASREGLDMVQGNTDHAMQVSKNFQRLMVDELGERVQKINLWNQLDECIFSLRPMLNKYAIEVLLTGDQTIEVELDPSLLTHLTANLVNNAVHHAFPESFTEKRYIRLELSQSKNTKQPAEVLLLIADNGIGMEQKVLEKAFDPLYTTGGRHSGSGLGLALIKRLVEKKARGRIELDTKPGMGCTYRIYLPLAPVQEPGQD